MTALVAARQQLEAYVAQCVIRAQLGTEGPALDGLELRRLENELVSAARFSATPEGGSPF